MLGGDSIADCELRTANCGLERRWGDGAASSQSVFANESWTPAREWQR